MDSLTANEAKTHFGELLLKANRAPIEITRNGKPVAVVISSSDYQLYEEMKLQFLKEKMAKSLNEVENQQIHTLDDVFSNLLGE